MKRTIRLTESDLKRVIRESVKAILKESYSEVRNSNNENSGGFAVFGTDIKSKLYNNIKSFYNGFIKSCNTLKENFSQNKNVDLDFYLTNIVSKLNFLQDALENIGITSLPVKNVIKYFDRLKNEGIENTEHFITYELDKIVEMIGENIREQLDLQ